MPSDFTVEALRQVIPSAFTEVRGEDGQLTHKVDFDRLRELLGDAIADADEERFGFYWVGKQEAKRVAAQPTRQTLRPVEEESVAWESTQNLYIEGDNLEVLKLLQTAYIGKVKMIYIDPPYNTGNDFVYNDDFAMSREEQDEAMGNLDEEGNRLRRNLDTNPRYHSDWCSMIYSRLLVARTLLSNDGVIFISIDDNEVHNLRKICDEVFGASNFVGMITRRQSSGSKNDTGAEKVISSADYILIYRRLDFSFLPIKVKNSKSFPLTDSYGAFSLRALEMQGGGDTLPLRPRMGYSIYHNSDTNDVELLFDYDLNNIPVYNEPNKELLSKGYKCYRPRPRGDKALGIWRWGEENFLEQFKNNSVYFKDGRVFQKEREKEYLDRYPESILDDFINTQGTRVLKDLFNDRIFSFPKPVALIDYLLRVGSNKDSLILDFFSGSATTAHAVMQLNAEDGGNRKYIMVQLPEETPEGSEARKAGYDTICEIGKERIRRAGRQIKEGLGMLGDDLDIGFRVLRLDSSNMEEVYFEPGQISQKNLMGQVDSVKPDRTPLDLLFGCMVDWGVELSLPIRREEVGGKELFIVNNGALVACFEEEIPLETIRYIAGLSPLRLIFRESCFATDADKLNIYEQFKQLCSWSEEEAYRNIRVI